MNSNTGNPTPGPATTPTNKKRRGSNSLPDPIDIHTFSENVDQLNNSTASEPETVTIPTAVYRNLLARLEKLEQLTNCNLKLPKINPQNVQKNNKTQKAKNNNNKTNTANFAIDLTKQTPFEQLKAQKQTLGSAASTWAKWPAKIIQQNSLFKNIRALINWNPPPKSS
jgi:hypothetical protein